MAGGNLAGLPAPLARLRAGRRVLAPAVAAVAATSIVLRVPLGEMLAVLALLGAVVAFAPGAGGAAGGDGSAARPSVWPDSAMKALLDAYPRAGFILDRAGFVRFGNARAGELFPGTRVGEAFALTFRQPALAAAFREAEAGRAGSALLSEPGLASHFAVHAAPVRRTEEGGGFVLVTFEDVSDRLAIARMRSDFVANASHELRTPLASLTGFIETLQGPAKGDPAASERFLAIMLDQARRMRRLLDDLLALSRAEMRLHQRPTERVEVAAIVRQVTDSLAPLAREHGVEVSLAVPDDADRASMVVGDRDELFQVFQNLIENAVRYGASGKRVEVSMPTPGRGEVAVRVRDFGPGIAPEHLPRLTERFYRVDTDASRAMKGTGLGLAIVKHILTRHQGRLDVESRLGDGATFTVELPIASTG